METLTATPVKTITAYKLFRIKPNCKGQLFPLFVNANKAVPVGEWIDAEMGEAVKGGGKVKSKIGPLAFRAGWHSGDVPVATHIGDKSHKNKKLAPDSRPVDQVWAEVEVPADVDWQTEANKRATIGKNGKMVARTAHITDQIPFGGHYKYKTNSNMLGSWVISGSMKVLRVLSDEEVASINAEAGVADLPRLEPRIDCLEDYKK